MGTSQVVVHSNGQVVYADHFYICVSNQPLCTAVVHGGVVRGEWCLVHQAPTVINVAMASMQFSAVPGQPQSLKAKQC